MLTSTILLQSMSLKMAALLIRIFTGPNLALVSSNTPRITNQMFHTYILNVALFNKRFYFVPIQNGTRNPLSGTALTKINTTMASL